MQRWIYGAVLVLLTLSGGCATSQHTAALAPNPPSTSPVIDRILQRRELRVGTSGNQPPLTAVTRDGQVIGFDADLAASFAKSMGVKLTLVRLQFPELLAALERGDVDMVISGLTMTPERNLHVAFVGPYLLSGMSILTKEKTMAELRKADEINVPKVKLAALRASTAEQFAREQAPKAKLTLVDSLDEGVDLVRKGKVDALLADHPFCLVTVYRYKSDHFETLATPFTSEPLGIALPSTDPLLMNWTQNALADLEDSGAIYDTMYHWFEEDTWVKQLR